MVSPAVTGFLVVFAVFGEGNGFMISLVQPEFIAVNPGGQFTLLCATDDHYEHCDWKAPSGQICNFEWKRSAGSVIMQECIGLADRVSFTGDYNDHKCGIVVTNVSPEDSGMWTCDIEQYVLGDWSRGTTVAATMNVSVVPYTTTTTTTTTPLPATTPAAVTSAGPTSKLTTPMSREVTTPMTTQKQPPVTNSSISVVTEQSTTELDEGSSPEPSSVPEPVPQKEDIEKASSSTPAVVGILVVLVVVGVLVGGVFYYRKRNAANGAVHYKPDPNDDKVTLNNSISEERDSVVSANSNLHEYYPPNLTYSTTTPDSNA